MVKVWVDDIRPAPEGYTWLRSVDETKSFCRQHLTKDYVLNIDKFDLDHDAGDYAPYGGDYINILNWLEEMKVICGWQINATFRFHSANPIGRWNMNNICRVNKWKVTDFLT